jgi:cytochrome oxidase Cu insertion factor (SCO1/SenC/PrrC family)
MHKMSSMKKILLIAIVCFVSCKVKDKEEGDIPNFNIQLLDSTTLFNTNKIPNGQPIAFIFFSPDCDHCEEQTKNLIKNIDSLKSVRFYFVSIDPFDRIKAYDNHYKLGNYPNIVLGRDYKNFFSKYFEINTSPVTVLFDKHKKLDIIFKGEVTASMIIKEINSI